MVLFKYGFIFLAGAGFGAAMAHRGERCCGQRRHDRPCWRPHWGGGDHRDGGSDLGRRRQELNPASCEDDRRGYRFRPSSDDEGSRGAEEGEHRAVKKNKKPATAAVAISDY
jgi:hypothetical protein